MVNSFKVNQPFNNVRLDKWFTQNVKKLPHSLIEKLIRTKKIKVNNKKAKSSYRLSTNDLVSVYNLEKYAAFQNKIKNKYKASKRKEKY